MIVLGNTNQQQSNQYKLQTNKKLYCKCHSFSILILIKVGNLARNICDHQGSRMGASGQWVMAY